MIKLLNKVFLMHSLVLMGSANAKTLKVETHFTASSPNGEVAAQFAKNVEDVFWWKFKNTNVLFIFSFRKIC